MPLHVDVISDVICPWCFVGKRRLEKAVAQLGGNHGVNVTWRPFELNPDMPREGISRRDYRTRKFGSWERSLELDRRVAEVAHGEGLELRFDRIERTPNTLDAHRLLWLAERQGVQGEVAELLFTRYFLEGVDVGRLEHLAEIAAVAGLDYGEAEAFLRGEAGTEEVQQAAEQFRRMGVDGVPFFLIDGSLAVSGAQPAALLLQAFHQALAARADGRDSGPESASLERQGLSGRDGR